MLNFAMVNTALSAILDRALAGIDLTPEEGLVLLQPQTPTALETIRQTADILRQQQVGDTVTYVVNRNVNYTNICEQRCGFCAFRRDANQPGAYWLDFERVLEKVSDAVQRGATEICMQGGLNSEAKIQGRSLDYYLRLVRTIKDPCPDLHVHAFSPQEVQFIARHKSRSTFVAFHQDAV